MSESLVAKAGRLLVEGRVHVREVHDGELRATVRGDHGTYDVRYDNGRLRCTCPSWRTRCSHAQAVALVVHPLGAGGLTLESEREHPDSPLGEIFEPREKPVTHGGRASTRTTKPPSDPAIGGSLSDLASPLGGGCSS
jgi:hypothetical protein